MKNFQELCQELYVHERGQSVGTLGEKMVHAALKAYYQPDGRYQEIRLGRYVADVVTGDGCVMEIQTRNFAALRKKLLAFLEKYEVTVVYPVARVKWIRWIDPDTGEIGSRRRSPRAGSPLDLLKELYRIKDLLGYPNLHFRIPVLEVEEFRIQDGWGEHSKKGATKYQRIPLRLYEEIRLEKPSDFFQLLPKDLPEEFSSEDFKKAGGISIGGARTALNVLFFMNIVKKTGKIGKKHLYQVAK